MFKFIILLTLITITSSLSITEYDIGYNQGQLDVKSNTCTTLDCCASTRHRLVELVEINEYLNKHTDEVKIYEKLQSQFKKSFKDE